jgi:hypothetical protein
MIKIFVALRTMRPEITREHEASNPYNALLKLCDVHVRKEAKGERTEVSAAVTMKGRPCYLLGCCALTLVEVFRYFLVMHYLHHGRRICQVGLLFDPEKGDVKFFRNVGTILPDYIA